MTRTLKIVSGGQTGVDRAALDAALALGLPCGGWCPTGRLDEDGLIPAHYPLKELKKGGYRQRTIQNILDSDGTLIFYFNHLEGGTEETLYRCIKIGRPYKLLDGAEISITRAIELTAEFVACKHLSILNVAGPRASKSPESYAYVTSILTGFLKRWQQQQRALVSSGSIYSS